MSTEREELRGTLSNTICNASNYPEPAGLYLLGRDMSEVLDRTADRLIADGYRKPYTITTAAERAALKPGTIAVDPEGNAWKLGTGSWVSTGGDTPPLFDEDDYTLTILQEPSV